MKQRLTALLLLVGVVGLVAFGRARPHVVDKRAAISAERRSLELPIAIEVTPRFFADRPLAFVLAQPNPLVDTIRSAPLYLHNRSLLL
jgi:hypothetical protein